jgi:hypothetical protein
MKVCLKQCLAHSPDLSRICGDYNGICLLCQGLNQCNWKKLIWFLSTLCKDGAKGSWTMGESWQMGHSTDDTS